MRKIIFILFPLFVKAYAMNKAYQERIEQNRKKVVYLIGSWDEEAESGSCIHFLALNVFYHLLIDNDFSYNNKNVRFLFQKNGLIEQNGKLKPIIHAAFRDNELVQLGKQMYANTINRGEIEKAKLI